MPTQLNDCINYKAETTSLVINFNLGLLHPYSYSWYNFGQSNWNVYAKVEPK